MAAYSLTAPQSLRDSSPYTGEPNSPSFDQGCILLRYNKQLFQYNDRGLLMDRKYNKEIIPVARMLRKNMTKEERHLWYDFLRTYEIKFTRQKVLGKYVADFYSADAKLIIELDGNQHYEEEKLQADAKRTEYLKQYGLKIIRIPNNQINQHFREICEYIDDVVKQCLG